MTDERTQANVENLKERVDRHLDECTQASHEFSRRLEDNTAEIKVMSGQISTLIEEVHEIRRAEERHQFRADLDQLKHTAQGNAEELRRLAEWRKFFMQRLVWWGVPFILTILASSAGLHLVK